MESQLSQIVIILKIDFPIDLWLSEVLEVGDIFVLVIDDSQVLSSFFSHIVSMISKLFLHFLYLIMQILEEVSDVIFFLHVLYQLSHLRSHFHVCSEVWVLVKVFELYEVFNHVVVIFL